MNKHSEFFIYDYKFFEDNSFIVRNKSKSSWKLRKTLQCQKLEPLNNKTNAQTTNIPHTFKSIYDDKYPSIGNFKSDIKSTFLEKEHYQSKLISPSINVNVRIPKI